MKKTRGPYKGKWDLPGGRPKHGETLFETLYREIKEETGLKVLQAIVLKPFSFVIDYLEEDHFISFHHTCILYQVTEFDDFQFTEEINHEDVKNCAWIEKSFLTSSKVSLVVNHSMKGFLFSL